MLKIFIFVASTAASFGCLGRGSIRRFAGSGSSVTSKGFLLLVDVTEENTSFDRCSSSLVYRAEEIIVAAASARHSEA